MKNPAAYPPETNNPPSIAGSHTIPLRPIPEIQGSLLVTIVTFIDNSIFGFSMKTKTELLLYQLLWAAEKLVRPTFWNLNESFEGWAYRSGYLQQIRRLEAAGFLESRQSKFRGSRVCRLTEAGRLAALGGRDPEAAWATVWDLKWRLFLFDVPENKRTLRTQITRVLAQAGCGCLQKSVWISPALSPSLEKLFAERERDCSHLILLEALSRGPTIDVAMVSAAWDFNKINARYKKHIGVLERFPGRATGPIVSLTSWAKSENEAWLAAVRSDPLLPSELLPSGYLGKKAWKLRKRVLAAAARATRQHPQKHDV